MDVLFNCIFKAESALSSPGIRIELAGPQKVPLGFPEDETSLTGHTHKRLSLLAWCSAHTSSKQQLPHNVMFIDNVLLLRIRWTY